MVSVGKKRPVSIAAYKYPSFPSPTRPFQTRSKGRFSLKGVKGASSARQFSALVETKGFEPIDVRFRPDSMERLIGLLGGKTLYGDDDFAALRELLQNAADAVRLRIASEAAAGLQPSSGHIEVNVERGPEGAWLAVSDDGVGMTERIVTNYLLGIASDYWHSPDFFADHPNATERGFSPVGRFGIGFLSVFMLGNEVQVDTQRNAGGNALQLTLRGIGTVFVPAKDTSAVTEGGKPASEANGVKFLRMEGGSAIFAVESGRYDFVVAGP
jgi:hypothetical protein